ncbi:MAG: undecaprenyl/decaprenyl-phosphate alpha-N-acetylglucosaminyl 1-phosphate transferase [Bacteroidetes bacterium]|nr:undecaprenyl/decaprenyl-phosphate alpha-N-acetylglucosaminyl 1-phosphate transferase [Bacteroidota bacterium]
MTESIHNIFFFLLGLTISLLMNQLLLKFSLTLGIRNKNDVIIRWSNQSKPSIGGVSLFIGFLASSFLCSIVNNQVNIFANQSFVGLFLSSSLAFLMGLFDDAYNTKPYFKLMMQILCGILLVLTGTQIDLFHILLLDQICTVLWVVMLMNSLNMLDNMDGITATTVFFTLLSCLFSSYFINNSDETFLISIIIAMLGAIIGFLIYNLYPAKLFMGDSGSQFIGLFVAFYTTKYLWNIGSETQNHSWIGLIITLTALTAAAADSITVLVNRLRKGQSPMIGGKDHTTHHLVYAGFNDRRVWCVFLGIGLFSFLLSSFIVCLVHLKEIEYILIFPVFFILVFSYLYRNTLIYKAPE